MVEIINEELSETEKAEREAWVKKSYERAIEEVKDMRRQQYVIHADPLFFKWQAGEGTEEDWLAKRSQIENQYPYPEIPS